MGGKGKPVDPWVRKNLRRQREERRQEQLRENTHVLPDMQGRPYVIQYYGGWGLISRQGNPNDMVSTFRISFKTKVRVGKVADVLVQALDHVNIEDLKK